jgi:hypothetical protein
MESVAARGFRGCSSAIEQAMNRQSTDLNFPETVKQGADFMSNSPESAKALVVLGMHRSGTSALAGVLSHLGVEMGSSLMPAQKSVNEKGFWEQEEIVAIHDRLLQYHGLSWDDPRHLPQDWWLEEFSQQCLEEICSILIEDMKASSLWAIKDPRMCRLLPLWQLVFSRLEIEPCFLFIVRNPLEVAASLNARDAMPRDLALLLWFQHNLEAIEGTVGCRRRFFEYGQLLTQGEDLVRVGLKECSITLDRSVRVSDEQENFLTARLRHHAASAEDLESNTAVPSMVTGLFRKLIIAAEKGVDLTADDWLAIRQHYVESAQLLQPWLSLSEKLQRDIANRNRELERLRRENGVLTQALRAAEGTIEEIRVESSGIDAALKEAQQIVREKEVRERQLDAALKEAQQIVKEREGRIDELNDALTQATGYVRARERDVADLKLRVKQLEDIVARVEGHWLLGYVAKGLSRSSE